MVATHDADWCHAFALTPPQPTLTVILRPRFGIVSFKSSKHKRAKATAAKSDAMWAAVASALLSVLGRSSACDSCDKRMSYKRQRRGLAGAFLAYGPYQDDRTWNLMRNSATLLRKDVPEKEHHAYSCCCRDMSGQ